jgi:hypothetical protein
MRIIKILLALILILLIPQLTLAKDMIDFKEVDVLLDNSSVKINLTYSVEPIQKLQMFLFGALPVKEELQKLFGSDVEFLSVTLESAVIELKSDVEDNTYYFSGIELPDSANVRIIVSGTSLEIGNTTEIPSFYYV